MQVTTLSPARITGFTGCPAYTPELRAEATFSDGYECAFVYCPSAQEPVVLLRRDGKGWTRNARPSRRRAAAVAIAAEQVWPAAFAAACDQLAAQRAWEVERSVYYRKVQHGPALYDALSRLVDEGTTPANIARARMALAEAEGTGEREFLIRDTIAATSPMRVRGARWDDALLAHEMRQSSRPPPGRFSVEDLGERT